MHFQSIGAIFLNCIPSIVRLLVHGVCCGALSAALTAALNDGEYDLVTLEPHCSETYPILESTHTLTNGSLLNTISEHQIVNMGASDLAGVLRRVPGVSVSRFNRVGAYGGGDGGAVFIRGHGSGRPGAQISTMIDGVPRFNGIWTHPLLDMISIDNARVVEVYKSPQPVLFGNMSFGVVNLLPKSRNEEGRLSRILASYGPDDTIAGLVENGFSSGSWNHWLLASHRESEGHRTHADGKVDNLYAQIGYEVDDGLSFSYLTTWQQGRASDPRAIHAAIIPIVEEYRTESWFSLGRLDLVRGIHTAFVKAWYEQGNTKWRQWDAAFPLPINETLYNLSDFDSYGVRLQDRMEWDNGIGITAGWELHWYGGKVSDVYEKTTGASLYDPQRLFLNHSVYAEFVYAQQFMDGKIFPSAGLRFNDARYFDDEYGLHLGLKYSRENTSLAFHYCRAFNYAGVYAAVFNGRWTSFGLPPDAWQSVRAETLQHLEWTAEQSFGERLRLTASVYHDEVADAISLDSPPPPVAITNLGKYRVTGVEFYGFLTPSASFDLFLGAAFQHSSTEKLPNYPEWTFSSGAHWQISDAWKIQVDATFNDSQYTQGTRFASGWQQVAAYFLLDARVSWKITAAQPRSDWEVFLLVENLTDENYEHRVGYPMPGITPTIGVEGRF